MTLADKDFLRGRSAMALRDGETPAFCAHDRLVPLLDILNGVSIDADPASLAGRSVLVRTREQLAAALALVDLDGVASRMVLCPPDFDPTHLNHVIAEAAIDLVVSDDETLAVEGVPFARIGTPRPAKTPAAEYATEWVMFTSGTTGRPKMVAHTLAGLTGAIRPHADEQPVVWGTFYDIRRYGGLQILLRALIGGATMIFSRAGEAPASALSRLAQYGVSHLSGTPSHWRRALICPALVALSPRYVRLSGEIADQAVLDSLKAVFPDASVGHAYASTEAGVGFEVTDGREGFPASYLAASLNDVDMRVVDGALQLRSRRVATHYIGGGVVADTDGFVDTGDMVERRGDRFHFVGRRGGVINVGGLKVHPEEIEAVINRQPGVRLSRVAGRRNPITGAVVTADIVLEDATASPDAVKAQVLAACRRDLAPHKTPAVVRVVLALAMTDAGKLMRADAR
ncbi:MAG TPA: AMP-binding protein [Caulobacteraceae bacterium]|jgi:acyl-coenzyme A synthetase/AMP-(fatty) acid ligase|nr:AMP-binding protein [Caulobacteraceae bacterium]